MAHSWHDPHIVRTRSSFLRGLYVTLGVFLFLVVLSHIAGSLFVSSLAEKSVGAFQAGIGRDMAYLKEQGDLLAADARVQQYLLAEDAENLLRIIQEAAASSSIKTIGVANEKGVIVSRTKSLGIQGDNVFLTIPEGRVVARGESVQNIGAAMINPSQLRMTTGRPVIHGEQMIGGLFTTYSMDDAYATRFRDAYLTAGSEVVFYNKHFGVYGESFSDPATRQLVSSYFNAGSDWIQNGTSGRTISFKGGTFYLIENIVFPGLEQDSPGGALLFVPRRDISNLFRLVIALLTLFTFIICVLRYHLRSRGEERGWRYYVLLLFVSIPVVALSFLVLWGKDRGFPRLERIPYILYNSTLRLQPESGIYDLDFEQRFSVVVDTGDEPINTVEIGLLFDPEAVEVKSLDTGNSACSYIIENTVDAKEGTAHLSCIVLEGAEEGRSIRIADVVAAPRRAGTFTLSFDKETTKVLADDGLATDVLRMSQAGSYRADHFNLTGKDTTSGLSSRSFVVFSPTHSNQSRWYNARSARFVWMGKPNAVYKYAFDSSPGTIPSVAHSTRGLAVDVPVPGDGIFYFHLQLASGGPIAHYRIQSDFTPPIITSMKLSAPRVVAGDVVRFAFEADDAASGIQRNYYVDLGNRLFLPVGPQLFIPFLEAGEQKIILRVYDDAGNYSEKSQIVTVENP